MNAPNPFPPIIGNVFPDAMGDRTLGGQAWYEQHIEEFVKPHYSKELIEKADKLIAAGPEKYLKAIADFCHWWQKPVALPVMIATLKRTIKLANRKPIVCPGRDTWEVYALARLKGFKDIEFYPQISSNTKALFKNRFIKYHGFDSGNVGSVPFLLGCQTMSLVNSASYEDKERRERAAWPNMPTGASNSSLYTLYSILESAPKYWTRANPSTQQKGAIVQSIQEYGGAQNTPFTPYIIFRHIAENVLPPTKYRSLVLLERELAKKLEKGDLK